MDRKKELKANYKSTQTDMGILRIVFTKTNAVYLTSAKNLNGIINSLRFQLNLGSHPNKVLQSEWKKFGEQNFTIEILDKLDYDKEGLKTDYTDDLKTLLEIWLEKLEGSQKI
jgi:hypothetical protein